MVGGTRSAELRYVTVVKHLNVGTWHGAYMGETHETCTQSLLPAVMATTDVLALCLLLL